MTPETAQWFMLTPDGVLAAFADKEPDETAEALQAFAAERGLKLSVAPCLRLVTHMDVSQAQIEQVVQTFIEFSRK